MTKDQLITGAAFAGGGLIGGNYIMGRRNIRKMTDDAIAMARKQYNPDQFNPQLDEARRLASEGINERAIRSQTLSQLFGTMDTSRNTALYGGNAAAAAASAAAGDVAIGKTLAGNEIELAFREDAAKNQGINAIAQTRGQMAQLVAQREASIAGAKLQQRQALNDLNSQTLGSIVNMGMALAMAPATGGTSLIGAGGQMLNQAKTAAGGGPEAGIAPVGINRNIIGNDNVPAIGDGLFKDPYQEFYDQQNAYVNSTFKAKPAPQIPDPTPDYTDPFTGMTSYDAQASQRAESDYRRLVNTNEGSLFKASYDPFTGGSLFGAPNQKFK